LAKVNPDPIGGSNLGGGGSEILGGEPGIITHNQASRGKTRTIKVIGHTLGTYPHVIKGEIIGDNPSPAIGAKSNGSGQFKPFLANSLGGPSDLQTFPFKQIFRKMTACHPGNTSDKDAHLCLPVGF
jgi:hypothetical protein